MIRTGLGIKLLGVCALVFASMALAASGAQAAPSWLVLTAGGTVVEEGTANLEKETTGVLHTKIAGVAVLFECTALTAENIQLKAAGTIGENGKVLFSGCTTKLNGETSPACEPKDKEVGVPGTIRTKPGHGVLVLHILKDKEGHEIGKDELLLLLPDNVGGKASEIFATIEMSAECAIGTKVNIIGPHFMLKDCENALLTHKEVHLIEEGPLTELWAISKTEEHIASILGSAFARIVQGGSFRSYAGHAG